MELLEERVIIKTYQTYLNKGFTLIELLVVISIISISAGTFYLLFQTPPQNVPLSNKVKTYMELSMYTGNSYYFNNSGIFISGDTFDTLIDDHDIRGIDYVISNDDEKLKVYSDTRFINISPSYEISIKEIILNDGTQIIL